MSKTVVLTLCICLSVASSQAASPGQTDAAVCSSGEGNPRIEACTRLLSQVRLAPANRANVLYDRASAYARVGSTGLAIADYSAAIALKPDFVQALNNRGALYRSVGQRDRAVADFSALIALEPNRDTAYVNRGIAYVEAGQYRNAVSDFEEAARLAPDQASAYAGLCWAKALDGSKPETALDACDTALRLQPQNASALGYRALIYIRLDDFDAAIVDYDRCVAIEPRNASFLYGRAIAKLRSGNPTGANEDLASAREIDPAIDKTFTQLGLTP